MIASVVDERLARAARALALASGVSSSDLATDPWLGSVSAEPPIGVEPGPDSLGRFHQRLLARGSRRSAGVFHTPSAVARRLVDLAVDQLGHAPASVYDPACGGGALLVAAAERLADDGTRTDDAVARLSGTELDPTASRVAAVSIALWALRNGGRWAPPYGAIEIGDPMLAPPRTRAAEVVIMNPPFRGQLRTETADGADRRARLRERWPGLVRPYTDAAALFLLVAAEAVSDDGVIAAIVPRSLLASRDSADIRTHLDGNLRLAALWLDPGPFDGAAVRPAAVVLAPGRDRRRGLVVIDTGTRRISPDAGPAWHEGAVDVPEIPGLSGHDPLGDGAEVIAAFRDEFYGMLPAIRDADTSDAGPEVVTSGLIDPLTSRWGRRAARIGGERRTRPILDRDRVRGRAATWVARQDRPKLLVANQTSVIEAVPDPSARMVGITPVLAVLPRSGDDLALVTALSCSPIWSALAARGAAGTGLAARTMRLSPSRLSALPVPPAGRARRRATDVAASVGPQPDRAALAAVAAVVLEAHGVDPDHPLLHWWVDRLPRSIGRSSASGSDIVSEH